MTGRLAGSSDSVPEQFDLFAERARLARDLEGALREGDFPQVRRLRQLFEETYGPLPQARALGLLDLYSDQLASSSPQEALSALSGLGASLEAHQWLRQLVAEGVLGRLLHSYRAGDLAAASPDSLPGLARVLVAGQGVSPEDGKREARRLVRDALLAGRRLESLDFPWDAALADLLAEDEEPPWLACLGVIRHLWPAPRPAPEDLAALSEPPTDPASQRAAALTFWSCLRAAEDRDCTEATLYEARRRMKILRPDFHVLYMRRVPAQRAARSASR